MQIIESLKLSSIRTIKRKLWNAYVENQRKKAISIATGAQCSGTPSYYHYRRYNSNSLIHFDNRISSNMIIDADQLQVRLNEHLKTKTIKLVFGGRLTEMKGVMDLPKFASELRKLEVDFTLDIFGKGNLEKELINEINKYKLSDVVTLKGAVDFHTEWLPALMKDYDIFICTHPQGDPSCTYVEVMSCGLPIVGYANEAFTGILEKSNSGWSVPVNNPTLLAKRVLEISRNRNVLNREAQKARAFAIEHTFEKTFKNRVEHLIACSAI